MGVSDRLGIVSKHLESIGLQLDPTNFIKFGDAWHCDALYKSPIGLVSVLVVVKLGNYYARVEVINNHWVVYKQVIDIT